MICSFFLALLKRFAPVVDYLIARLGTQDASPAETESKYQYQRAYALSRDLKDQILDYSNTQLHQLQSNSVLVYVRIFFWTLHSLTSPSAGNAQLRPRRAFKMSLPHPLSLPRQELALSVILWFPNFKRYRYSTPRNCFHLFHPPVGCDSRAARESSGIIQACARRDCKHDF